jgi:hypothetical protein
MATLTMNTHLAVKALKDSGFDEKQAEKIVEVIADLQSSNLATKDDIKSSTDSIKVDLSGLKTDMDWIKKLIMAVGVAVVIAALKYIFIGG